MVDLNPSASFSLKIELEIPNRPGALASIMSTIATHGGSLGDIVLLQRNLKFTHRELMIDASSTEQGDKIIEAIKSLPRVKVINYTDRTFSIHQGGKISVESKLPLHSQSDLAMAYTPGVGRICRAIAEEPDKVYDLTIKSNTALPSVTTATVLLLIVRS
ncbi:MAG: ACT domain-containing protein [Cyanobacteria bacterium J06635_13]